MAARSGHIAWGPWVFDYNVTDFEGLALTNGSFRGISVFYKLSLPVIRVKYVVDGGVFSSGCGPYNDIIRWDPYTIGDFFEDASYFARNHHLAKISDCGNGDDYVCVREIWGGDGLELGVYARIGEYHLYQVYYLHRTGMILPRLWSKGLSCNLDHKHHPYWRFDLDVDGVGNRVNFVNNSSSGFFTSEGSGTISGIDHHWNLENTTSGNKVWIVPGDTDTGRVDSFSHFDFYLRKYRHNEDREWWRSPEQDIAFSVHESINNGSDMVFWYIAHLAHEAAEGENHWHGVGPTLMVDWVHHEIPANQRRRININGSMHVVDDEDWSSDEVSNRSYNENRDLSPDNTSAEFFLVERMGGEIRVELRINMQWHPGFVSVSVNAKLFEGTSEDTNDLDAQFSTSFNINDNGATWTDFTIVNSEWNSPDLARIQFRMENNQRP